MSHPRRVVVTGLGAISAAGRGVGPFWRACLEGRSMLRPISRFDAAEYGSPLAGEVPDDAGRDEIAAEAGETVAGYARLAAREALAQAALAPGADAAATGLVVGTCLGEAEKIFQGRLPATYASPAERLASTLDLRGPVTTLSSACASGTAAVGLASDCIRRGEAEAMLACGAEMLSLFVVSGFWLLRALASGPVRPFDRRRDGLALGEGAAVLVLEERERARERGATTLAEVLGSGSSSDAHHMTGPSPAGDGVVRAIEAALRHAGCSPAEVDFINAHGTGTQYNDRMETIAIKRVFGARAYEVPVVSIKPIVGHTLGAAGALEAILSVKVLEEGLVPPTINYGEPDAECDLDYVPNRARRHVARRVLSSSSAFGGTNSALLLAAP